jgi:hypothetical protein
MENDGRRIFRRKKRWQGAVWSPKHQPALYEDGKWCKKCKTRHGYMTMDVQYEKRGDHFVMLWLCKTTRDVVGETKLGGASGNTADGS